MWNTAVLFHYFLRVGGAAPGSAKTVQKVAESFNEKGNEASQKLQRTKTGFALLKSAILCLRGSKKLQITSNIDNSICL